VYGGVLYILYCVFCFVLVICMVVSYTYCIVFFVLFSLCVWWCPTHIVLCFLLCPRYVYGGVLCILYCVFCFVLVICMVVSYTYCIVFCVLSLLYVWWCPIHIVLCLHNTICIGHHHTHNDDKTKNTIQYV
jgi:hypothetical protein